MDEINQMSHLEPLQEYPSWLGNNIDTQHFGDTGQPYALNAWYTDQ